jgi:hypothetical protein
MEIIAMEEKGIPVGSLDYHIEVLIQENLCHFKSTSPKSEYSIDLNQVNNLKQSGSYVEITEGGIVRKMAMSGSKSAKWLATLLRERMTELRSGKPVTTRTINLKASRFSDKMIVVTFAKDKFSVNEIRKNKSTPIISNCPTDKIKTIQNKNIGIWLSGILFVLAFPISRLGQTMSDSMNNSLAFVWVCAVIFVFIWELLKKYATVKLSFKTGETYTIPCTSKTQILFLFHYVNNNILNRPNDQSALHDADTADSHKTSVFTVT